jgi:hypothetical protein
MVSLAIDTPRQLRLYKAMRLLFLSLLVAAVGGICYGSAHDVTVSGAISYQDPTAATPKVKTIAFNNKSVVAAGIALNGNSGLKDSDFTLALDDTNYQVDVVNKVSHQSVWTICFTGTNPKTFGAIVADGKHSNLQTHIQTSYIVDVLDGEFANCGITVHSTVSGTNVLSNTGYVEGGTESTEAHQGLINFNFRTSGKPFTVIPPAP